LSEENLFEKDEGLSLSVYKSEGTCCEEEKQKEIILAPKPKITKKKTNK
jgi:hypothetical protein